jgi:hypothetical protein
MWIFLGTFYKLDCIAYDRVAVFKKIKELNMRLADRLMDIKSSKRF